MWNGLKTFPNKKQLTEECPWESYLYLARDYQYKGEVKKCYHAIPLAEEEKLYELLQTNHYLNEVIVEGMEVFPYFDLEMEEVDPETHRERLDAFIAFIVDTFEEQFGIHVDVDQYMVILDSCRPEKLSYHLVIKNCYFQTVEDHKLFVQWLVKQVNEEKHKMFYWKKNGTESRLIFDTAPYTKFQCFRLVNQSKFGKTHVLTTDYDVEHCLVRKFGHWTYEVDGEMVDIPKLEVEKFKTKRKGTSLAEIIEKRPRARYEKEPEEQDDPEDVLIPIDQLTKYEQLLNELIDAGLLDQANGDYNQRLNVGFAIANTWNPHNKDKGLTLYMKFIMRRPEANHQEYAQKYETFRSGNGGVGFRSILYIAKQTNATQTEALEYKYFPSKINPKKAYIEFCEDGCVTGSFAKYFKSLYGDRFVSQDQVVYHYNGTLWKPQHKPYNELTLFVVETFLPYLISDIKPKIEKAKKDFIDCLDDTKKSELSDKYFGLVLHLKTYKEKLNDRSQRTQVIQDIVQFIANDDIKFDTKPHLFAFDDAIFDLRTGEQTKSNPSDFISMSCGYNYPGKATEVTKTKLNQVVESILPDKAVRDFYLMMLATSMIGSLVEHCVILTGGGGNGKSLLSELMMDMLGPYAYELPTNFITKEISTGADPQTANLDNKRFVRFSEPETKARIKASTLKTITGNQTLNSRQLYSNKTDITLTHTLFGECNTIPRVDEINQAIIRRFILIPFDSRFVSKEDYDLLPPEEKANVHVKDIVLKTATWREEHRAALFELLLPFVKDFLKNKDIGAVPDACKALARHYFSGCDDFYGWFCDNYEQTEVRNIELHCDDIFNVFKESDFYRNLSKADKRKYTKTRFYESIETNMFLRRDFKDRGEYVGGVQLKKPALVGWVEKPPEVAKPTAVAKAGTEAGGGGGGGGGDVDESLDTEPK